MTEIKKTPPSIVLLVTTFGAFMSSFAGSSVNVALPPLGLELGLGGIALNWVTTAFVLGSAILLLPMGRLGDIFGRKRLLTLGFSIYALGAFLSFIAPNGAILIAMRAITGFGASMLAPTSAAILVAAYPSQERGRVLGINVAAIYFGLSAGPFIGGYITSLVGWRSLFLIIGMMAFLMLILSALLLKDQWQTAKGEKMDWAGTVIYALGLLAVLVGFSSLPHLAGIVLLITGLVVLMFFVLWELKSHHPLLHVRIFKGNRAFTLSNLAAMISYSATFSVAFFLSLYLEVVRGLPPHDAGLLLVAQPIMQAIFSPITGKLSDRIQPRFLASAGMVLSAGGLGVLAFLDATTPIPLVLVALVLIGLGFALFSSPNTNAVMSSVEHKHLGIASATISTMRAVGMAASMGLALVLFSIFLGQKAVVPANSVPFLAALHMAFVISAILCFLGIFASMARGKVTRS